jgi:hypothetical protein
MTNARRTVDDLIALWHRCDYCLAEAGVWCVVARGRTTGTPAVWLHADRLWPTQTARYLGHTYARAYLLEEILREIHRAGSDWSDLPANPQLGDVLTLLEKRLEQARSSRAHAVDRTLAEVPAEWRRG